MFLIKNILKRHQIETYLLMIFPIAWILITGLLESPPFSVLFEGTDKLVSWRFFFGGYFVKKGFLLCYLYMYFKVIIWIGYLVRTKLLKEQISSTMSMRSFLLSFMYVLTIIGLSNLLLLLCVKQLSFGASRSEIIKASQFYMSLDRQIFGCDPQLWIQQFSNNSILDFLFIQSYFKLPFFLSFIFIGLLVHNKNYFRKFLIMFFMAPVIAMPCWYLLPAISPNEMYRHNIFSLPSITQTQNSYKELTLSDNLNISLQGLENFYQNPNQAHPIVSTNPSMHVCWGTIVTYFAMVLWRPLGLFFVPWLLFNSCATLYTIQHYFIDIPSGLACGIIVIMITNYFFSIEKKYYTGHYAAYYFIDTLQEDIRILKNTCFLYWAWIVHRCKRTILSH